MRRFIIFIFIALYFCNSNARSSPGGIRLEQSRVVYVEGEKTPTITVNNDSSRSYIIQARVQSESGNNKSVPFILTPPLFILKGGNKQLFRIVSEDSVNMLPLDRESIFYVAITAVPSRSLPVLDIDRISVGLRFVIKLLYRPSTLAPPEDNQQCQLVFSRHKLGLHIVNPTPYSQTLGKLVSEGKNIPFDPDVSMVKPKSNIILSNRVNSDAISWQTITDYGELSNSCQQKLNRDITK